MKNIQISISIMKWPVNITTMNGMTKIFLNIYMGHGGIANMFSGFHTMWELELLFLGFRFCHFPTKLFNVIFFDTKYIPKNNTCQINITINAFNNGIFHNLLP